MSGDPWVWTTEPNTPERLREMDEWMARQNQAAIDKLALAMRESMEECRIMRDGIGLIEEAFGPRDRDA
jgi:hypothetical protein